jgi:hypothetical protein
VVSGVLTLALLPIALVSWTITGTRPAGTATGASPSGWDVKGPLIPWSGVYTGSGGVAQAQQFAANQGAPVQWAGAFLTGGSGWSAIDDPSWYIAQWPASTGLHMDWSIPILNTSTDTLEAGATGAYNSHFLNLAKAFVAAGQPSVTFRLGWEMASTYQQWSAESDPVAFAEYWRQIVTTMRSVPGQKFKFDWNGGGAPAGDPVYQAYPGDAYVDYITNDIYDQSWNSNAGYANNTATTAGYESSWGDIQTQLNQLASFGAAHGKPIGLPEWGDWYRSDGHGGGDDPYFLAQMYKWLTTTPNVAFAIYYDADNDGYHNLYDGQFPHAAATWTALMSGSSTSTPVSGNPVTPVANPVGSSSGSTPATGSAVTGSASATGSVAASEANLTCPSDPTPSASGVPVQMASMKTSAGCSGYWVATASGSVAAFGAAPNYGSLAGHLNAPIIGITATPDGGGYWLLAADGGVFSFGDASFYGSTGALKLNKPVVGMASTPDGRGYWLVASDGGVFSFGDASFYGSTGALKLNKPVVAMASTSDGRGYYMTASDGGVFSFGDATFQGSMGGSPLAKPIVGMSVDPTTGGYRMVASDGGVFSFNSQFYGSVSGTSSAPIDAMAPAAGGGGYYLLGTDGTVHAMGPAPYFGEL